MRTSEGSTEDVAKILLLQISAETLEFGSSLGLELKVQDCGPTQLNVFRVQAPPCSM